MKLLLSALLALTLCGCGTIKSLYDISPPQTNIVDIPTITLVTNTSGGFELVETGHKLQTNITEAWTLKTNLTSIVDTARGVNSILPTPAQPIIDVSLWLLTVAATAYGAYKSKKNVTLDKALTSVIVGVERAANAETKTEILTQSRALGVQESLDKKVQALTG